MRSAAIFKFADRYVIHSDSTSVHGFGIASDPYITLSLVSAMEDIVKSLLFAMNASKINVIVDVRSKTFLKEHLKFMGLKNRNELYTNSICCSVYEKDNKIVLMASNNMGLSGGFTYPSEKKVEIASIASIEEICSALVEALSRCE
ncbi:contact-dependent growth inhibition system immunity protein [Chitinophaga sp. RCC_12]|uniref:contact-dependent growth inhibition system immunity protein n=1 Tax=Chitinophaga sp. RCC_12 TaxID=3239226 RepID=UPI003524AB50